MIKKIERWFYLQLQLMLNMYHRKGNPSFTYEETHTPSANKSIKRFGIRNKNNQITDKNIKYWNDHYNEKEGMYK